MVVLRPETYCFTRRVEFFPESEVGVYSCLAVVLARTLFFELCRFRHKSSLRNGMSAFTPCVHPIIQLLDSGEFTRLREMVDSLIFPSHWLFGSDFLSISEPLSWSWISFFSSLFALRFPWSPFCLSCVRGVVGPWHHMTGVAGLAEAYPLCYVTSSAFCLFFPARC